MTSRPPLPPKAYENLIARDGEKCHDCGATGVPLDVEHHIPLWSVEHLPKEKRAWYNTIANMYLRCRSGCHRRKSNREAAARAHYKRLEARSKPKRGPLIGKDGQRLA